jgi:hypothetical protein
MAWFAFGALLLLLAVPAGRGKTWTPVDALGVAAIAAFAAGAGLALPVYSAGRAVPVALAWAAALGLWLMFGPRAVPPRRVRLAMLAIGAASCLFAVLGPAEGLF